jgi:hypothetical protein
MLTRKLSNIFLVNITSDLKSNATQVILRGREPGGMMIVGGNNMNTSAKRDRHIEYINLPGTNRWEEADLLFDEDGCCTEDEAQIIFDKKLTLQEKLAKLKAMRGRVLKFRVTDDHRSRACALGIRID